jgi:TRAP-type C4-dicarboxylate transport system permease small subunit
MGMIDRLLSRLECAALVIACAALFITMLLVFTDAVLRYTINMPLKFTMDIVTLYLLSAALLLVLSDTLRRGGHIGVDLFAKMLPRRAYHILIGFTTLCSAGAVGIMAYETTSLTWESWLKNELQVGIYAWPLWLSKAIVATSLVLLVARLLHIALSQLIAGATGDFAVAVSIAHVETQPVEDGV